ncbi:uncharacterized protein C1orf167 homolog [Pteronotus mesoamericanus]|uniref:uncharacterized protein C1orf167 homolog n=1 Tax=Pteronotus mesoamericanus TaxID=1884717 RepID=UPI0023ED07AE|nr:uncharacterized protein C1orf167 homolog [Pteronotus parnellii mesoamericanus]
MELRPDSSHKENVPPRPATPLRPEPRRLLKTQSLDVALRRWVPRGQAERGGPASTPCPGPVLGQEPCRVQTNLASPGPRPGLALKDATGPGRLISSSFQRQSNVQPLGGLPPGTAPALAVQQSNLGIREASLAECGSHSSPHLWLEPPERFWPHMMPLGSPLPRGPRARPPSPLKQSWLLATDTPYPGFQPIAHYAPVDGDTRPGPSSWGGLGNWTSGLMGEPLTLEDLAVPAKSQACIPSQAAISQLLASVQHLEHKVASPRCWGTQKPLVPSWQEPWASDGQALPACLQRSQPVLASWDKRKKHPRDLRGAVDFPGTPGVQLGPSDSQAGSKPAYSRGQRGDPLLPQGVGSREARLCSSTFSRAARGVLPGQEGGEEAPREQVSRKTSCRPATAPAGSALQNQARNASPKWETAHRQLLSRCFRAWRRSVRRRRAVAEAAAPGRRQLLRRGLQALRWALWLREAQLEVACSRHTRALLARSFHKWRNLTQQQKQEQPYIQARPGPPPSGEGLARRKPAVDPAQGSSPGSLKEEAGTGPTPSPSGPRPDGGDRRAEILQALQQLAAFLLWCRQQEWARQRKKGVQREAPGATLSTGSVARLPQAWGSPAAGAARAAPLDPQHQRAWLRRCFGAWRRLVKRGAQSPDHLADRPMGALRMCLKQRMWMKRSQVSDGAEVTQLSPGQQKAGRQRTGPSAAQPLQGPPPVAWRGVARAQGPPQEPACSSLQEACPRLALQPVLLLRRARLSQRQQANSFLQGIQQQMLRHILRVWHLTVWGPDAPSDSASATLAPAPLGRPPGGEAPLGRSPAHSSSGEGSRAPALLETLRLSFLWAAGRRQQGRWLLLWQAQAWWSQGAAPWHQHTLQRRVLLSWHHWATAQGARRELAARWAWDRSCRAALGLWRRRLEQEQEAEQRAQKRGRRRARDALQHWQSRWQRQQFLHEQYQRWVQAHIRGLRRAVFQSWQRAAAQRGHRAARPERLLLQSHFQAWYGSLRGVGMLRAQCQAFQDGLRRRALGAAFTMWQEARVAAARTREHSTAWASIACWRSHLLGGWADRQLRRARAQKAFVAWRVALGQHCEAHQKAEERAWAQARVALCWTLWVPEAHQRWLSQVHAAQKLNARVLEAWAQSASHSHVQRVTITQSQQVGYRQLLWTHWAQWRTALLQVWLEPWTEEAQETSPAQPRLTSRGRFLVLMDAPDPGKQEQTSDSVVQLWMQWPRLTPWAQGQPPAGRGGDCSPEAGGLLGKGQADKRWLGRKYLRRWHLEALLRLFQGSQQARRLVATWQRWVDAQGAEELARSLHHRGAGGCRERRCPRQQRAQLGVFQPPVPTAQAVAPEMGLADVAVAGRAAAAGSAITATRQRLGPFSGPSARSLAVSGRLPAEGSVSSNWSPPFSVRTLPHPPWPSAARGGRSPQKGKISRLSREHQAPMSG